MTGLAQIKIVAFIVFIGILTISSCDRVSPVAKEAKGSVASPKSTLTEKKDQASDKVFPTYDADRADTKRNRRRFRQHLTIDPSDDVRNVFAYGDFMGSDYKVLMSFKCDSATVSKIIRAKKMRLSAEPDIGLIFGEEFPWWDKHALERIRPYKEEKAHKYWTYLWYDSISGMAYYEEFSL